MNDLRIDIPGGRVSFQPLEEVAGTIAWALEEPPRSLELRLLWMTRGRGIVDSEVVQSMCLETPPAAGDRPFRFRLPDWPYSLAGKLVTVQWALQLLAASPPQQAQVNLIVSPTQRQIELGLPNGGKA